jgi:hypothetical protein
MRPKQTVLTTQEKIPPSHFTEVEKTTVYGLVGIFQSKPLFEDYPIFPLSISKWYLPFMFKQKAI